MNIFIPVSNTCEYLPLQVFACKKYLPDWKITVLYSPQIDYYLVGSKNVSPLSNDVVSSIQLPKEILEPNDQFPGHKIYDWILQNILPDYDGMKLLIHSDLFPIKKVDPEYLLQNKLIASRACGTKPESGLWTWILFNAGYDVRKAKMNGMCLDCQVPVQGWESIRITKKENPVDNLEKYKDLLGFEWCEPYWLHSDKVGLNNAFYPVERKLEVVKEYFEKQHGYQGEYTGILCEEKSNKGSEFIEHERKQSKDEFDSLLKITDTWNGKVRANEQVNKLFKICRKCEHFKKRTKHHGHCELAKAPVLNNHIAGLNFLVLNNTKCPIDKWGEEEGQEPDGCGGCGGKLIKKTKKKVHRRRWSR